MDTMGRDPIRTGALALLLLGTATGAATAGSLLRFKGAAGDAAVYQMKLGGSTTVFYGQRKSASQMSSEAFMTQRVDAVADDGTLELVMTVDSGRATVDGREQALPVTGRQTRSALRPDGETRSRGEAAPAGLDVAQLQLVFPEQPVEVGTSWSKRAPPSEAVPVALETTYRVVGFEQVGELPCVRIVSEVRSVGPPARPDFEVAMQADGVILFAHERGFMVDNQVHAQMTMAFLRSAPGAEPERVVMKTKLEARMAWQYRADGTEHGDE